MEDTYELRESIGTAREAKDIAKTF